MNRGCVGGGKLIDIRLVLTHFITALRGKADDV